MKPEDYYITNGVYPDGTCVFHLWRKSPCDDANLQAAVFGILPYSYPLASNTDRAVLEKAIEHLCQGQPG